MIAFKVPFFSNGGGFAAIDTGDFTTATLIQAEDGQFVSNTTSESVHNLKWPSISTLSSLSSNSWQMHQSQFHSPKQAVTLTFLLTMVA